MSIGSNKRQKKHTYTHGTRFIRVLQRLFAYAAILVQLALPIAPVFASEEVVESQTEEIVVAETPSSETPALEPTSTESPVEQIQETTQETTETGEVLSEILQSDISLNSSDTPPASDILQESNVVTEDDTPESESPSREEVLPIDNAPIPSTTEEEVVIEDSLQAEATSSVETTDESVLPSEIASSSLPAEQIETIDVVPATVEEVDTTPEPVGVSTTTSSSTEEVTVLQPEIHTVINDNNRFSFSEQECARVGDGTFYCSTEVATTVETGVNRVFAAQDADGDQEIYIESEGSLTQISNNLTDDSAPYYDEESESIVWHRLVNERYQIVSYDIESATEEVLTADRYNNMEPSRSGDMTVWQGWVGNDWEIMIDADGELTMLTDNTTHDIAPRINGEYIIWQSFEDAAWKAKIYNIRTKVIETIADTDGTSVGNPRFVLVYDAKSENGDVETRGYDPVSGTNVSLSSEPMPTPSDIPDPDQTGEDRALITTNAQLKTKVEDETEPDPLLDDTSLDMGVIESEDTDIVIPPFETEEEIVDNLPEVSTSSEEILDIVISPIEIVPPVPNLIIPPYIPSTEEAVLPQQTVATSS